MIVRLVVVAVFLATIAALGGDNSQTMLVASTPPTPAQCGPSQAAPVAAPEAGPRPGYLSMAQIAALVRDAGYERDFGRDVAVAFTATLWHESAEGEIAVRNREGSGAAGIAQIMPSNVENLGGNPDDPVDALRMAKELSDERVRRGKHPLSPWHSYTGGFYESNMDEAEAAYASLGGAPAPALVPATAAVCTAPVTSVAMGPGPTEKAGPWGGHGNGRIPREALCPTASARGHMLRCDAASALDAMAGAYQAETGRPLCITSTYRSYAGQVDVYARKPGLAAVPGTSNHGWALAVDFCGGIESFGTSAHRWMQQRAGAFGFVHPSWAQINGSRPEPWHFEFGVL